MLISTTEILNNKSFLLHYSDDNKYIQKVGTEELYQKAYDIIPYEYIETEIEIEVGDKE